MADLPPFPTDDATLLAVEHALGGAMTYDRPDGADGDGPWLTGADYSLTTLLDFLAGATGEDPNRVVLVEGDPTLHGWEGAEIVEDTRTHYDERDVIAALVAEVRRLRSTEKETP